MLLSLRQILQDRTFMMIQPGPRTAELISRSSEGFSRTTTTRSSSYLGLLVKRDERVSHVFSPFVVGSHHTEDPVAA